MTRNSSSYSMAARTGMFFYGIVSYLVFFGSFIWAVGFLGGFVPNSLDEVAQGSTVLALAINFGLLLLFAVQHSVMARPQFKAWFTQFIPAAIERSTYVLVSSIALIVVMYFWQPLGGVIWQFEGSMAKTAMYLGFGAGWLLLFASTCAIDHFDLFGLRQVWFAACGTPYRPVEFQTPFLYRVVRHPIYLGWLLAIWCTPNMTAAHLFFALVTTIYIFVGIQFEERDLTREHPDYDDYKRKVPMILPGKRHTISEWRDPQNTAQRNTVEHSAVQANTVQQAGQGV